MSIDFSDQDLVSRVRHGDTAAFGDLYAHHSAAAHRAARRIVRDPHLAEDVVSESFARVFKALQGGNGPTGDLLPYLLVTMRNVAASWGRESVKWTPVGDDAAFQPRDARDLAAGADELPVDRLNMSLTSSAFETLPRRWRTVLWYLEVEGESATDVGQRLGLSDVAVRQLARRAREGLREAYLAAYLGGTPTVGVHVASSDLVSMARGKLSLRRRAAVEKHLDTCPTCSGLLFEAAEENSTLRALVLPFYMAVAFALVKWSQALGARIPKIPGKHLVHTPAVQAGLAAASIVAVVTTALAVTPQLGGAAPAGQAGAAQQSASGLGSGTGSTSPPAAPRSSSSGTTPSRSVSVTPTSLPPSTSPTSAPATQPSTVPPSAPSTTTPSTTSALPIPTVGVTGEPTQSYVTALPSVIFPTAPTVPTSNTAPTTVVPTTADSTAPTSTEPTSTEPTSTEPTSTEPTSTEPTSTEPTSTEPTSTEPTSTEPTSTEPTSTEPTSTEPTSTEPTSTEPTSTAPTTTAPTSTAPTSTAPTSTAPTTTAPTTTAPTTTAPTEPPGPDLSIVGQPVLEYPASRQFPNDTDFKITVRNGSSHRVKSVVTFSLPGDVELSADLNHVSCRTNDKTVVCKYRVPGYWATVPANGSVTYDIFLDHRGARGKVDSMPMPTVHVDPNR
jgi:RNA polymerase sigma factor (sigma-70 family)